MVIRPLTSFDKTRFCEIARGYVATQRYVVHKEESEACTTFTIALEDLVTPYVTDWPEESTDFELYEKLIPEQQVSLGAYDQDLLIGLAIVERQDWNGSLWVREFHVHKDYHRQGIGRKLMEGLTDIARQSGLRILVCETQNTNVGAIRFYRRVGFVLDGLDLSLYPPEIQEVAFFMKRRV